MSGPEQPQRSGGNLKGLARPRSAEAAEEHAGDFEGERQAGRRPVSLWSEAVARSNDADSFTSTVAVLGEFAGRPLKPEGHSAKSLSRKRCR